MRALQVTAEYRLLASNAISMTFTAETDAPTIVNLVNHAYWNLSGNLTRDIKEQVPWYLGVVWPCTLHDITSLWCHVISTLRCTRRTSCLRTSSW